MELRDKMKHLERAEEAEMTVLVCGECGEEMRVAPSTDLEYIAYLWTLETSEKSYQPTPRTCSLSPTTCTANYRSSTRARQSRG
jgi:hypothetical protein